MTNSTAKFIPDWLKEQWAAVSAQVSLPQRDAFRQKHWDAFVQQGLPCRNHGDWKHSDLSFLANDNFTFMLAGDIDSIQATVREYQQQNPECLLLVSLNGNWIPELSSHDLSAHRIIVSHWYEVPHYFTQFTAFNQYPMAHWNIAMSHGGFFLFIPDNNQISKPIHHLSLFNQAEGGITHPHYVFLLGQNSQMTWVEETRKSIADNYLVNAVTTMVVGKNAAVKYSKLHEHNPKTIHLAHTFVWQMQNSQTDFTHISAGSRLSRENLVIELQEEGAECQTAGFYHLHQNQYHLDHHVNIEHQASHTKSDMLYKGVLNNRSRAAFSGRVKVMKQIKKICAYQANHNLLLSKQAEVYTKPVLEIDADDVQCKHGATVGQLDEAALFYLRARGISQQEATAMLLQGFAEEIFQRLSTATLRERAKEIVEAQ